MINQHDKIKHYSLKIYSYFLTQTRQMTITEWLPGLNTALILFFVVLNSSWLGWANLHSLRKCRLSYVSLSLFSSLIGNRVNLFPTLLIFHSNGQLHTTPCLWFDIVWGITIMNELRKEKKRKNLSVLPLCLAKCFSY